MTEWWTYRLHSFLMFSPRTYGRLVEGYNVEWWPLQVPMLLLGLVGVWLVWRAPRWGFVLLAVAWGWTAWAFLWERYSQIFLGGAALAGAFAVEAVLLVFVGWRCPQGTPPVGCASHTTTLLVILYPLVTGMIAGTTRGQSFGMFPDPTAVITLVIVLTALRGWRRIVLAVIPALATLTGALTLLALLDA